MNDFTRHLAPRLRLRCTPSGWYTLDWDVPAGEELDLRKAIENLETLIEYGNLPPATGPKVYYEDSYRTAEEVLSDLKKHV